MAYVGAGRGTASVNLFFPSRLRVRVGDTVTWRMNADGDPHTVTFTDTPESITDIIPIEGANPPSLQFNPRLLLPTREAGQPVEEYEGNGYFNSGIFFGAVPGAPSLDSYSLRFGRPGVYAYVCGIHDFMKGTVVVESPDAAGLPDQEEVNAQAIQEAAPYLEITDYNQQMVRSRRVFDQEAGPQGTAVWIVSAGIGPREAEVVDFLPKELTINAGDTVVWTSHGYHSVVFSPDSPNVRFYLPSPPSQSPPVVGVNPKAVESALPSAEYDGAEFVSSGLIGPNVRWIGVRPAGVGFALTFTRPGTYAYVCPIHASVGMTGVVTVQPR